MKEPNILLAFLVFLLGLLTTNFLISPSSYEFFDGIKAQFMRIVGSDKPAN